MINFSTTRISLLISSLVFTSAYADKGSTGNPSYGNPPGNPSHHIADLNPSVNTTIDFNLEAPPGLISSYSSGGTNIAVRRYNGESWEPYPNNTTDDEADLTAIVHGDLKAYYLLIDYKQKGGSVVNKTYLTISTRDKKCIYVGKDYFDRTGKEYYIDFSSDKGTGTRSYRYINKYPVCTGDNVLTLVLKPIINGYLLPYTLWSYNAGSYNRVSGQKGYVPLVAED
tara:strand:- start:555 stop:1232 length:678 start_codon:yes stop_codon:yes gene_type:complete